MHGYYPPPWYGYPPQPTGGDTNREYIRHLKKLLKDAKGKKPEEKKEEKKMWWKRFEITTALFFLSPFIFIAYLGVIKLAWLMAKSLIN